MNNEAVKSINELLDKLEEGITLRSLMVVDDQEWMELNAKIISGMEDMKVNLKKIINNLEN